MRPPNIRSDRGAALLAALLLSLIISALATAMMVSGQTEVSVVRNYQRASEARAAADAGLSHSVQLAIRNLNAFQANGFATPNAAITSLLRGPDNAIHATPGDPANADNGSLEALEIGGETELPRFPALVAIPGMVGTSYQARIIDEDHPSRNLTAADRARIGENGQADADGNGRAVVQVTGFALDNTIVTLEAIIARTAAPAIVSDQSIIINGNPDILGSSGGVHSNDDLTLAGNPTIAQTATATDTYSVTGSPSVGGEAGGGRAPIAVPPVNAADHRAVADYVLGVSGLAAGRVYGPFADPDTGALGPMVCDASISNGACVPFVGWIYEPGNNGWRVSSNVLANGTYYVPGNVRVTGNPGAWAGGPPEQVTILAEGNIDVSGTPRLQPDTQGLLFVTNGDLEISGNMVMTAGIEGLILVREQMRISGNPDLFGQIWVDNAASFSNFVNNTQISGNPEITYNGTLGSGGFSVTGWREVR
jgi:hypothetical protein